MARTTKRDAVLQEIESRLRTAQREWEVAVNRAEMLGIRYTALQENYESVVKALAPKPRGQRAASIPAPSAEKKSPRKKSDQKSGLSIAGNSETVGNASSDPKPELCGVCGNERDFNDHVLTSRPGYHEFEGKKLKATA